MYDLMRGKLKGLEAQCIAFGQDLVRIKSPSRDETNIGIRVKQEMEDLGFDRVVTDDFGNVFGVIYGSESGPNLLLASHMDTIEPPSESTWSESPWSGRIESGNLFGLGASDCKGGLAAQIFSVGLLKRCLLPLRGNLVVAGTVAEENGISLGMRGLVQHTLPEMGLRPDYAILGEPTGLGMYYGHDGRAELEITLRGPDPFQVSDAVERVSSGIMDVESVTECKNEPEGFHSERPQFQDADGWRRATIGVEQRLGPSDRIANVVNRLRMEALRLAGTDGACEVEVAVCESSERLANGLLMQVKRISHAWCTDPFSPLLTRAHQALTAAGCEFHPGKWALARLGMGTSGSFLVDELNIPTIGYGPGREEAAHSIGESVEISKLLECTLGTASIAHSLVGIPVFGWVSDEI